MWLAPILIMSNASSELSFKFKFVRNRYPQGILAQKGYATSECLVLGKQTLDYNDILDTTTRDNRTILLLNANAPLDPKTAKNLTDNSALVLEIYGKPALDLERFIDRISSRKSVERKRQELIAAGNGNLFRSAVCPECEATIDLSSLNRSSYIYCRFCESIFAEHQAAISKGSEYRICDECHMFDRVQGYTEFYFYFLLVVYGFSYNRRYLCDTCANRVFWKTLLINFIFILGILPSLWIKIKSLKGRDRHLKNLPKANALAKKGKYQQALSIYTQLEDSYPQHPGLLMNQGLGHLFANDVPGAMGCFGRSLQGCSNYGPTLRLIKEIQSAGTAKNDNNQ